MPGVLCLFEPVQLYSLPRFRGRELPVRLRDRAFPREFAGMADRRHRAQSRTDRLLQIHRPDHLQRQRHLYGIFFHSNHRPSGRHFLLHLRTDQLSDRDPAAEEIRTVAGALCVVRQLLPPSDRRTHHPSASAAAAIFRSRLRAFLLAELRARHELSAVRPVQENHHRRQHGRLCNACIRRRGARRNAGLRQCLGRRARLHLPDLFRLLRLFGHGGRPRHDVRLRAAVQFQLALQGDQHHRFLAPLAHHAVAVPARLRLHPARRQPVAARPAAMSTSCSRC